MVQTLIMVMDRNREHAFRIFLTDDVIIKDLRNFLWCRNTFLGLGERAFALFATYRKRSSRAYSCCRCYSYSSSTFVSRLFNPALKCKFNADSALNTIIQAHIYTETLRSGLQSVNAGKKVQLYVTAHICIACVLHIDFIQALLHRKDVIGVALNVRGLAAETA